MATVQRDMRILVVDDHSEMRRIIRNLLTELGYSNVTEAQDGAAALAELEKSGFDAVVTDWSIPGGDNPQASGLDLLRAIRADRRLQELPVLMLTAEARREQIVEAARAGVSDCMVKPFTAHILEAKLVRLLERRNRAEPSSPDPQTAPAKAGQAAEATEAIDATEATEASDNREATGATETASP